jgi:hypothetical protein
MSFVATHLRISPQYARSSRLAHRQNPRRSWTQAQLNRPGKAGTIQLEPGPSASPRSSMKICSWVITLLAGFRCSRSLSGENRLALGKKRRLRAN